MSSGSAVPDASRRRPPPIARDEFALIRSYIEEACGILLPEDKSYLVQTRLTELLGEQGCHTFYELYRTARNDPSNALRDKIVDAITTRETLWFRDESPFAVLEEVVLKEVTAQYRAGRRSRVRVWCAGCATGQEPYSVAITVLEHCRSSGTFAPAQCEVLATDISASALYVARTARYGAVDMDRGLPARLRERYFTRSGNVWTVRDEVRNMVSFGRQNLQDPFQSRGPFDMVFCRNVLIYFGDSLKREVIGRVRAVLRDTGVLVLGSAEGLSRHTERFRMERLGAGMFYRPC